MVTPQVWGEEIMTATQREIKFEVKLRRKDGSDGYIEILTLDDLLDRNGCLYNSNLWEIVYKRQYTNLKDIDKEELYEGDILLTPKGNAVIEYHSQYRFGYRLKWKKGCWVISNTLYSEKCKLIGNIHENKELLK